jgi:sulfite reductase alpha subunit-like flavoprotein
MGKDVLLAIEKVFLEKEGLTQEEAKTRIAELESGKKIIKELWG